MIHRYVYAARICRRGWRNEEKQTGENKYIDRPCTAYRLCSYCMLGISGELSDIAEQYWTGFLSFLRRNSVSADLHAYPSCHTSLAMAHDSFLKEHLAKENEQITDQSYIDALRTYLYAYKEKYKFDRCSLYPVNPEDIQLQRSGPYTW